MPVFTPMTPTTPLPAPGTTSETALFDLKKQLAANDFDIARDVAAFANNLGGTLLIGAEEDGRSCLLHYHPLSATDTDQAETRIGQAIDNRCRPRPLVDFARLPQGNGFVLAVNVWPFIGAVVGVQVKVDTRDGHGTPAFLFPFRLANRTTNLSSENLAMHMLPQLRRSMILLASIPPQERVALVQRGHSVRSFTISQIDETANTLRLRADNGPEHWVPLDAVRHVYQNQTVDGVRWHISIVDPY